MRKKLKWLIPTVIAPEEPVGEEMLEHLCAEIENYFTYNRNFKVIYSVCISIVNILPLFTKGRTLRMLKQEARENYLHRLLHSRNSLLRGISIITGLPIKMIYYNQEAEQVRLGFNAGVLKEEANLRLVSRSKAQA